MSTKDYSMKVVAMTLWGEARGEPVEGKMAVASVIFNRAAIMARQSDKAFGESVIEEMQRVCLAPAQFSCWSAGVFVQEQPDGGFQWKVCEEIAKDVCGEHFGPLITATHYFAVTIAKPVWADGMDFVGRFGNQLFYADGNWR